MLGLSLIYSLAVPKAFWLARRNGWRYKLPRHYGTQVRISDVWSTHLRDAPSSSMVHSFLPHSSSASLPWPAPPRRWYHASDRRSCCRAPHMARPRCIQGRFEYRWHTPDLKTRTSESIFTRSLRFVRIAFIIAFFPLGGLIITRGPFRCALTARLCAVPRAFRPRSADHGGNSRLKIGHVERRRFSEQILVPFHRRFQIGVPEKVLDIFQLARFLIHQ